MEVRLSVVIPVFNNAAALPELIDRVGAALAACPTYELVLVDDGSQDSSWQIIADAAADDERVLGVRLSRNFGQHPAIRAGLQRSSGTHVVLMDADLQDRPEEIPRLLEALGDAHVVFTTWESRSDVSERWTSRVFHSVFARLAAVDVPRNLGTFRLMTREYCEAVLAYPETDAVFGPLMAQMGFDSSWVEVVRDEPRGRRSSYSVRKRAQLAANTLLSYSDLPYRFVSWVGFGLFTVSAVYLAIIGVQYVFGGRQVASGITLVIVIQLLVSGALLASLGVLGAYLFRIFRQVLRRPHYHVRCSVGRGLGRP